MATTPRNGKVTRADHALATLEAAVERQSSARTKVSTKQEPTELTSAVKMLTAAEVMTTDVFTCMPDDTLDRCAQIMWEQACGCVPVVDFEGAPISMVTDRDVCMAAYTQGKPLHEIRVDSMMSKRLFTARTTESLRSCEAIMRRHGIRRLPIIDHRNIVVGILSFSDIVLHGHLGPLESRDSLSAEAIAETVTCISHVPRPKKH